MEMCLRLRGLIALAARVGALSGLLASLASCRPAPPVKSQTWVDSRLNLKYVYILKGDPPRFAQGLLVPFFGPDGRELLVTRNADQQLILNGQALPENTGHQIWIWNGTNLIKMTPPNHWFQPSNDNAWTIPRPQIILQELPVLWPPVPSR